MHTVCVESHVDYGFETQSKRAKGRTPEHINRVARQHFPFNLIDQRRAVHPALNNQGRDGPEPHAKDEAHISNQHAHQRRRFRFDWVGSSQVRSMEGPTHPQHAVLWILVKVIHRYIDPKSLGSAPNAAYMRGLSRGRPCRSPVRYDLARFGRTEKRAKSGSALPSYIFSIAQLASKGG